MYEYDSSVRAQSEGNSKIRRNLKHCQQRAATLHCSIAFHLPLHCIELHCMSLRCIVLHRLWVALLHCGEWPCGQRFAGGSPVTRLLLPCLLACLILLWGSLSFSTIISNYLRFSGISTNCSNFNRNHKFHQLYASLSFQIYSESSALPVLFTNK